MEDQTSPEQLRDSFRGIAGDKVSFIQRRDCAGNFGTTCSHL